MADGKDTVSMTAEEKVEQLERVVKEQQETIDTLNIKLKKVVLLYNTVVELFLQDVK